MTDEIVVLRGPDRVRRRPKVIFGDEGPTRAAKMLVEVFLTEAAWGYCRKIDVRVHADGGVSVRGCGRSILLDDSQTEEGTPLWAHVFCDLYGAPAYPTAESEARKRRIHSRLFGGAAEGVDTLPLIGEAWFDWCCPQYAAAYMRVESVCGGVKTIRQFRAGYADGEAAIAPTDEPDGVGIFFLPDGAVFDDCTVSYDALAAFLQEWMGKIVGLQCTLRKAPGAVTEAHRPF